MYYVWIILTAPKDNPDVRIKDLISTLIKLPTVPPIKYKAVNCSCPSKKTAGVITIINMDMFAIRCMNDWCENVLSGNDHEETEKGTTVKIVSAD